MKRIEEAKQNNQIPKIGDIFNDHVRFLSSFYIIFIVVSIRLFTVT